MTIIWLPVGPPTKIYWPIHISGRSLEKSRDERKDTNACSSRTFWGKLSAFKASIQNLFDEVGPIGLQP